MYYPAVALIFSEMDKYLQKKPYAFGVSTTVDYTVSFDDQLNIIAEAGFDFISIGADIKHSRIEDEKAFRRLLEKAEKTGLKIESFHLPFGIGYNPSASDDDERRAALDNLKRFIEKCCEFDITAGILHPHHYLTDAKERCLQRALVSLEELLKFLPENYRLAVENLPNAEGSWICDQILDQIDADSLGFCYDSSHENIGGKPFYLLEKYCPRLFTTHLSDNHGQTDDHLIPGRGIIDWPRVKEILDKSPLSNILFEVGTGEKLDLPISTFLEEAYRQARRIFVN
jgi:sugar phosphate isomerase/epimerase